ncbi:MAG TPA: ABC transporter permease, partial [Streptosporangiaceae bacterium]
MACIVIYNTQRIVVTQRGRELALLRCVGASRGQVFGGTLLESLLTGLVASAAGTAAGLGFGWGLQRLFTAFGAPVPAGPVVLSPTAALISMATGVAVTLAAALLPARSATRVAPVAALGREDEAPVTGRIGRLRVTLAVVLSAAGIFATCLGLQHVNGAGGFVGIAAGGCLCFLAVLALGP